MLGAASLVEVTETGEGRSEEAQLDFVQKQMESPGDKETFERFGRTVFRRLSSSLYQATCGGSDRRLLNEIGAAKALGTAALASVVASGFLAIGVPWAVAMIAGSIVAQIA